MPSRLDVHPRLDAPKAVPPNSDGTTATCDSPAAWIKAQARRLGFELAGIAPAVTPTGLHDFLAWLERDACGDMHYLPRRASAYHHPRHVLDGVRSVVMLGMNYFSGSDDAEPACPPLPARVARYAQGSSDYHDLIRERLTALERMIQERFPESRSRGVVDTAPLLERDFARLAGLGWFGKNTMLIHKRLGSLFFLAALLTDLELESDAPHATSHCGTCTRCLDACPTDAFIEPYVLDPRRCISYLTIEHRGPIPMELREGVGEWLFGCDICQDVCPWNRKAPLTAEPAFTPRPDLSPADAAQLLGLSPQEFRAQFRETPLWRPKRAGLLRNAAIVLGNAGDRQGIPALLRALEDEEPLIRGAAAWALGHLGGSEAQRGLSQRIARETDPAVLQELEQALKSLGESPVESLPSNARIAAARLSPHHSRGRTSP
ncbi:MAG: tRNA epoxyqueuosine(34) reductase QueG [Planctomycetales bacterium]